MSVADREVRGMALIVDIDLPTIISGRLWSGPCLRTSINHSRRCSGASWDYNQHLMHDICGAPGVLCREASVSPALKLQLQIIVLTVERFK